MPSPKNGTAGTAVTPSAPTEATEAADAQSGQSDDPATAGAAPTVATFQEDSSAV